MPSFQDSAVIFFIALLLFGPKKLPELARYVGKLMNEFRRASSEFRMQMDDEFRQIEQAEHQKKIAAMEAAAPVAPPVVNTYDQPITPHVEFDPDQPPIYDAEHPDPALAQPPHIPDVPTMPQPEVAPLPIATSGDISLMPPSTGLPIPRNRSLGDVFDSIPHTPDPVVHQESETQIETPTHG
jgi:sec-independent protein translocase protein TatB